MPIQLATASGFVILAKTGISTVPTSVIGGDIGLSPAAASYITGFSLTADVGKVFSKSAQVNGKVYAADYAPPTPANLTKAIKDMEVAFTEAANRSPAIVGVGAGNIGGKTLTAGTYKWTSGLLIPTSVTLSGTATDVWVFQVAQNLTVSSAVKVNMAGGALAKHVFWQVSGLVDIGTTAHMEGTILCQTNITLQAGASIQGRLMSQAAVNISSAKVLAPN